MLVEEKDEQFLAPYIILWCWLNSTVHSDMIPENIPSIASLLYTYSYSRYCAQQLWNQLKGALHWSRHHKFNSTSMQYYTSEWHYTPKSTLYSHSFLWNEWEYSVLLAGCSAWVGEFGGVCRSMSSLHKVFTCWFAPEDHAELHISTTCTLTPTEGLRVRW